MLPVLFELPQWIPLLGGAPITSFGVMMFLSFFVAGVLLKKEMIRLELDGERAWDILFAAVVGGIVGAKAYYVLLNFDDTLQDPIGMIFARGGLVWYGGFLLATLLVYRAIRRHQLPLGKMADAIASPISIAYAIGRMGCFLVGDDYGRPTDHWVGIAFPEGSPPTRVDYLEQYFGITVDPALVEQFGPVVPVHPTQLYEVAMSTAMFLLLWRLRGHRFGYGWLFSLWLVLAGIERFLVEIVRVKDDRFIAGLTLAQLISILLIVVGIVLMVRLQKRSRNDEARPDPAPA